MLIIRKLIYLLFVFFLIAAFANNIKAQTCSGSKQWKCAEYTCALNIPNNPAEGYKCVFKRNHTYTTGCGEYFSGGCYQLRAYSGCSAGRNGCNIINCSPSSTTSWGYCGAPYYAPTPTPTPSCKPNGTACAGGGGACCSRYCDLSSNQCANPPPPIPACVTSGNACSPSDRCCDVDYACVGGRCCKPNGASCAGGGGSCCSGYCDLSSNQCTIRPTSTPTPTPFIPPTATPTPRPPTPTPTPTTAPALPWFKLRDASLVGNTSINNPIPVSPITPYDADDPGNRYLIDNSAGSDPGIATGQNISIGGAIVSAKNWKATGTSYVPQYTVSKFIDYVRSKKSNMVVEIAQINDAESGKVNILTGSPTITDGQLNSLLHPFILIVVGDVTLSGPRINPSNQPQVIMSTGKITFNTSVREANGLYIADSLDFGTTTNQGIKIIGNLIAQSSFSNARSWINGKRPGLFIIFDPSHYLGLLNMFSTVSYDWRQIQ